MSERKLQKFRFIVGGNGRPYSARWSISTHKSNVYVASATIGHAIKASLHGDDGSLVCQVAYTMSYHQQRQMGGHRKSFVRWKRAPTPDNKLLHVASLQFPSDFLNGKEVVGTKRRPLMVLPPGGPATEVEVGIFFTKMDPHVAADLISKECTPLVRATLENQEHVIIAGRIRAYSPMKMPTGEFIEDQTSVRIPMSYVSEEGEALLKVG